MTKIAIIRCEKNEKKCPLTSCLKAMTEGREGFAGSDDMELVGVFTCRCPGDDIANLAKILKSKGAQRVHFTTCMFAHKDKDGWVHGEGLCPHAGELAKQAAREAGIPCVLGSAHLPNRYIPELFT
jgi:predicted metal-binding protein